MDRGVARGLSVRGAARRLCRTRRGLSLSAILITYYRWLRSGRDATALRAKYRRVRPAIQLTAAQRRKLPCLMDEGFSLAAVHAGLFAGTKNAPTMHAFRRTFSKDELQFLRQLFSARRNLRARERAAGRKFRAWVSGTARSFAQQEGAQ